MVINNNNSGILIYLNYFISMYKQFIIDMISNY